MAERTQRNHCSGLRFINFLLSGDNLLDFSNFTGNTRKPLQHELRPECVRCPPQSRLLLRTEYVLRVSTQSKESQILPAQKLDRRIFGGMFAEFHNRMTCI